MSPTPRLALVLTLGLIPALLAIRFEGLGWAALLVDAACLAAAVADALRIPRSPLRGERRVHEPLVALRPNRVEIALESLVDRPLAGELADAVPERCEAVGHRQRFALFPRERRVLGYALSHPPRGAHRFGDLHLRVEGPWRLAARQLAIPAAQEVSCRPDLSEPGDGLLLARPRREAGLARLRRPGEGRELDALRAYRPGDDPRAIDWKASARRGGLVTREFVPEHNQAVLLLLDCGRHMFARSGARGGARTKLDHAVEAALRLARTGLERGDAVGLLAFGAQPRAYIAPGRGRAHLRALLDAACALEPELEESDYGGAFDLVQRHTPRRALICTFTDLVDEDASRILLARTLGLRPKHLPLLVALRDAELSRLEEDPPAGVEEAYARAAAVRLLREREIACARLRQAGALVVSAREDALASAAINEYLRIKDRGLL